MENNNYVSVGNIIEQERLKRQSQIAKGVSSDVYDHIEKAHQDDLSKGVEMTDNLSRFADDVDNLNKAETEFLLSKIQRQIVADPESSILKSFRSIAIDHLNDIEKAVYADNAQNRKLGRVGQEWGRSRKAKEKTHLRDFQNKEHKVSEKDGSALMGKLMEAWELDSNHSFGERKKWENKLVETLNKMGKSAKWFNENAEVIANVDTGEYDDELEKLYNVNGIDDLFSLVREIGDDTENEPVADSSSDIGNRIISALKADQGGLNNSSAGKKAQMKIVAAAENFMKKNPKVKLSNEDLENMVGGDIDEIEEKYGKLKGWNKLNDAIESYFDAD